jgi:hypothetical protein
MRPEGALELPARRRPHRFDAGAVMPLVISIALLGASLWVILSKNYEADTEKWAFGCVGTIVGYWLPQASSAQS